MIPRDDLRAWCVPFGLDMSDALLDQLDVYAEFLVEYNQKVNLTAITDPAGIAVKHFLDSLLLLAAADIPAGASLIDVGTGAGFPGVPVHLMRDDLHLTLLDSLNKRIGFLQELCQRLNVNASLLHARAEDAGRDPSLREQFDFATARAVASLPVLCEYCLPFVRVGGIFAALKSRNAAEETAPSFSPIPVSDVSFLSEKYRIHRQNFPVLLLKWQNPPSDLSLFSGKQRIFPNDLCGKHWYFMLHCPYTSDFPQD